MLPAFVLMSAQNDLIEITQKLQQKEPSATALDALVEVCTVHYVPANNKGDAQWSVYSEKTGRGWLVPIPIGFQSIAPEFAAGELAHCRNQEYPSQYTESVYSLGKWVFPHRLADFSTSFWRYHTSNRLFLVTQSNN